MVYVKFDLLEYSGYHDVGCWYQHMLMLPYEFWFDLKLSYIMFIAILEYTIFSLKSYILNPM